MRSINNVLCTGGSGFVGYWMQKTKPDGIRWAHVDKRGYRSMEWDWWTGWDVVVHLAPVAPTRVLEYAKEKQIRVLFASSGAVYDGVNEYADNKRKWERECLDSGLDVVIARLFTFVGEKLKNHYAITNFIDDARNGRPIQILGDGSAVRSYLYGEDLGRWMWSLLLGIGGTYDVGSCVPYTTMEVARLVADIIPAKIEIPNTPGVPNSRYLPNITRSEYERVGLREAIERTTNDRYYVLHASPQS